MFPLVALQMPLIVRTELVLIFSVVAGIIFCYYPVPVLESAIWRLKNSVDWLLKRVIIPVLPLYVLGFLLKIRYEGVLVSLMEYYGGTIISIAVMQLVCLLFVYLLAARANVRRFFSMISNAIPSYLTAFSTMSSTVTVPVSITCAKKNGIHSALADVAMPILANVHMLGDSIGIPSLALITKLLFTGSLPSFIDYTVFIMYFCVTMFASSGIPGGAILVMIPILISHLGFTTDMITIITTLFLMLDSFGTAANVMGDGALVVIVQRLLRRIRIVG